MRGRCVCVSMDGCVFALVEGQWDMDEVRQISIKDAVVKQDEY